MSEEQAKLQEVESWAENTMIPYTLRQLLHYAKDTIKQLTEEMKTKEMTNEMISETLTGQIVQEVELHAKSCIHHHLLLQQKDEEIVRLKRDIAHYVDLKNGYKKIAMEE